jgi:beta-lactamase regulating signal transducer with metallopeptidase domain
MAWTLLRASLDGALVVLAVWLLTRTLTLTPATRTILWWCAAAKFVLGLAWIAPIEIPILPAASPQAAAVAASNTPAIEAPNDVYGRIATRMSSRVGPRLSDRLIPQLDKDDSLVGAVLFAPLRGLGEWSSFAAIAWLGGLLLIAFVAIEKWRATSAIVRASTEAPPETRRQASDLAARLNLKRVPDVRISERVETPLVARLRRPVVLLPASRFAALTSEQQEMALCHELTHVKRADLWLGCVPALAERLFFFHPLAHFMSREYSLAREAACDAAVVATLGAAPRDYGSLLLALGVSRPQAGAASGAAWSFMHLKRRIAMLQEFPSITHRSRAVAAGAVGLAILALVPLRLVARPASSVPPVVLGAAEQKQEPALEPIEREKPGRLEAIEQERAPRSRDLAFVLFLGDKQRTVSGSTDDLEIAERHRRNDEPMLWFRLDGREYVVRDAGVLREAEAAWQDFNEDSLHKMLSSEHFESLARLGDSKAFEQAGQLGAELGSKAFDMAHEMIRNFHIDEKAFDQLKELGELKGLEHLKELEHLSEMGHLFELDKLQHDDIKESLDKLHSKVDGDMREMRDKIRRDVERSFKGDVEMYQDQIRDLQHKIRELEAPLKELSEPIRDLAGPMSELGRHMGKMGREFGDQAERSMEQMRAVIERAIASGRAQTVK